jgi:PhnB protein
MKSINPYLNFDGNTEEAFNFYKSVFGGEFKGGITRFKDTAEAKKIPEKEQEKVMHVALPIGNGNILMGTDALESMGQSLTQGNNFYITISAENKGEADELFKKLSEGGEVEMEMQKTFWDSYFGMFKDKFGIQWMIDCELD